MLERAQFAANRSKGEAMNLAYSVPHVLADSQALVFQGLRSDGHTEGLCYVGCPPQKFTVGGGKTVPSDDEMFFVFVCEERTIYTWRWERIT